MSPTRPARIAVLAIGDELLSGEVADTNFPHIAASISRLGFTVSHHVTVGDERGRIASAIRDLAEDANAIIITGGLGPTSDDVTRESVSDATSCALETRPELEEVIKRFFESMGRPMSVENLKQARLPCGARAIPPAGATAPGFMMEYQGTLIAALPGVPIEVNSMLDSSVLPELEERFKAGEVSATRRIMTFGVGESDVASLVSDLERKSTLTYAFLVMGGPVVLKFTATAPTREEATRFLDEEQGRVEEVLGALVYGIDDQPMEEVVGGLLRDENKTLSVAESCTGGMVCERITNVPGSSDYFTGGLVTYGTASKKSLLGLCDQDLEEGLVSGKAAEAMAAGVRRLFVSDLGVGVTGVAGPGGGGEGKPVGTVCIGLASDKGVVSWDLRLPGDRPLVRSIAAYAALNVVRLHLLGHARPGA